jgi:hypothetical protein
MGKGKDNRQCFVCGQTGHLSWQCTKGAGKASGGILGAKGKGQTWELANVNQILGDGSANVAGNDDVAQVWQTNLPEEVNLGGTWDNSISNVSPELNEWVTVMRRAKGRRDNHVCLNSLERSGNEVNCISEVNAGNGQWEKVTVTVDSGAVDSVGPPTMAKDIRTRETPASRAGMKYRAANGTSIVNQGEKAIQGMTRQGQKIGMAFQIANVTKPLGAVRAMLDAGNKVIFDRPNSYIVNKATKSIVPIDERNGAFVFDIWIPKGVNNSNRFQALAVDNKETEDFAGQDELF